MIWFITRKVFKVKKEVIEKLQDIIFMKKLMSCNSMEEAKLVFKDEKIEVSDDDIRELAKILKLAVKKINSMKEEELQRISGGSPIDKIFDFAHYPVNHTVDCMNRHIPESPRGETARKIVEGVRDFGNTAMDVSLWAGLVYVGYKGFKALYNTAIKKGWISDCD